MNDQDVGRSYDNKYKTPDYFRDRKWLYRPFLKALLQKAKLKPGARILDVGCGQGFFSGLLVEMGFEVLGIDISEIGILSARKLFDHPRIRFEPADVRALDFREEFDCVFTRSLSLYNSKCFQSETGVTDMLLRFVRSGGLLIFVYHSKLGQQSNDWLYHSIEAAKQHFAKFRDVAVYFSVKPEAMLLGSAAFSSGMSKVSATLSKRLGVGGEIIALVRKEEPHNLYSHK